MARDHITLAGAERLKGIIEGIWWERGYDVKVEIKSRAHFTSNRNTAYDLRSDMVNGLPVRRL